MRIFTQDDMPKMSRQEQAVCDYIWKQAKHRQETRPRSEIEKQILAEMTHRPKPPARPEPPIWWTDLIRLFKRRNQATSVASATGGQNAPQNRPHVATQIHRVK